MKRRYKNANYSLTSKFTSTFILSCLNTLITITNFFTSEGVVIWTEHQILRVSLKNEIKNSISLRKKVKIYFSLKYSFVFRKKELPFSTYMQMLQYWLSFYFHVGLAARRNIFSKVLSHSKCHCMHIFGSFSTIYYDEGIKVFVLAYFAYVLCKIYCSVVFS